MLPEFEHQMATSRPVLERVPADPESWQPHPKSMSPGELASHLADIPFGVQPTIWVEALETAQPGGEPCRTQPFTSPDEAVQRPGRKAAKAGEGRFRHGRCAADASLALLRTFLLNHMIRHRGELTIYPRLKDLPLPGIYGPSADER